MDDRIDMKDVYQKAVQSQNACNLSGLVYSLAGSLDGIWKEAREQGKGTDYVNKHPIVRLYLEQMVFLNGGQYEPYSTWLEAYNTCKERGEVK